MFKYNLARQWENFADIPITMLATAARSRCAKVVAPAALALCFIGGVPTFAATHCCVVAVIAPNGQVTAREVDGTRTLRFQVTDPVLLRRLKPGAPVYANFATKQVSLDGRKACCKILEVAGTPEQPAQNVKAAAAPRSKPGGTTARGTQAKTVEVPKVEVTASEGSTATAIRGRPATSAAPAKQSGGGTTAANAGAQTQAAQGLIVTLEAVLTDTSSRQIHVGVTGGREASAAVLLSSPARPVQYDQAGRGTREGPPIVLLSSSDPGVLDVPQGVAVPIGEREGRFTFLTSAVAQPQVVTITATFKEVSKSGTVKVVPSQLLRIETPTPVRGGHVVQGRVILNGPPANAASGTVKLASDNAQLVKVPNTVTVAADQTQASFAIETFGVADDKTVMLAATHGEQGPRTASLTLSPPIIAEVDAGGPSSAWCVGPCTRSLRVVLDGKAPAEGLLLTLESELPVHIPASATFPAGATEVAVPFTATQVTSNTSATLSASYGVSKKRVDFKVFRLEKHDLYVRRAHQIIDRFGNVVAQPPDSQPFQLCVNVAHKKIPFHTSGQPSPTALEVTHRISGTGRTFQVPVTWEDPVYVDKDVYFKKVCIDLPGIEAGGVMNVETIADVREELDERNEGNNDRSFKIER